MGTFEVYLFHSGMNDSERDNVTYDCPHSIGDVSAVAESDDDVLASGDQCDVKTNTTKHQPIASFTRDVTVAEPAASSSLNTNTSQHASSSDVNTYQHTPAAASLLEARTVKRAPATALSLDINVAKSYQERGDDAQVSAATRPRTKGTSSRSSPSSPWSPIPSQFSPVADWADEVSTAEIQTEFPYSLPRSSHDSSPTATSGRQVCGAVFISTVHCYVWRFSKIIYFPI